MKPITMEPLRLKLRDVRSVFRLIGEVRELGSDPQKWRPHMVRRLRKMVQAEIVISSEIHFRQEAHSHRMRVIDIQAKRKARLEGNRKAGRYNPVRRAWG